MSEQVQNTCFTSENWHVKGSRWAVLIGWFIGSFIHLCKKVAYWAILCPLIGKDPDAGMDWGQEEKGEKEDEMAGWHHQPDGHEFE